MERNVIKSENEIDVMKFENNGSINLSNFEKRQLKEAELNRRLSRASLTEKRQILEEVYNKNRILNKEKINQMKREKNRQLIFRKYATKAAIYGTLLTIGVTSVTLVKNAISAKMQPVNVVATDMMANAKLLEADGKKIDAQKFDENDTDKLYQYITENNIDKDQIYTAISKQCKREGIDYLTAVTKLNEKYPEIFEQTFEQNKIR